MQHADLKTRIMLVLDRSEMDISQVLTFAQRERTELLSNAFKRANLYLSDIGYLYLDELDLLNKSECNLIIPIGELPLQVVCGLTGITKWHCSILKAKAEWQGKKALPCLSPTSAQKQFSLTAYLTVAAMKAKNESAYPELRTPTRKFLLSPSFEDTLAYLHAAKFAPEIGVDIETSRGQINTVGIAISPTEAIAIRCDQGHLTKDRQFVLFRAIQDLLESPVPKVLQNWIYEAMFFSAYGIYLANITHDTMWAMKFLHPEFEKGLHNVGRIYTPFPYWKEDGKEWTNIKDWNGHLDYNCLMAGVPVITDQGNLTIDEIVSKELKVNVMSLNETTGEIEYKPVVKYLRKKHKDTVPWIRIVPEHAPNKRGIVVTPEHKILTQRGWVRADELVKSDYLCHAGPRLDAGSIIGTLLGDASIAATSNEGKGYLQCAQVDLELVKLKQRLFGGTITSAKKTGGYKEGVYHSLYVPSSHQLERIRKKLYPAGKKVIAMIEGLNPMGIALLFMDDGYKAKSGKARKMMLATQCFASADKKKLADYFSIRYEAGVSVTTQGSLSFTQEASERLCQEIGPHIIPSMRYKLSHPCPEYDAIAEAAYMLDELACTNVRIAELGPYQHLGPKRGLKRVSFCITVKDNSNFFTPYGLVANCKDTTGTLWAKQEQKKALEDSGMDALFYGKIMQYVEPIREMCTRGLLVDEDKLLFMRNEANRIIEADLKTIDEICMQRIGKTINMASPKQKNMALKAMGYDIPTKWNKSKGEATESTDKKSITKLMRKHPDDKLFPAMFRYAEENKELQSYVNAEYDLHSKKLRYTLDGCSTETLRMASYTDPWGKGFNVQTVPSGVKTCFKAEPGKVLIEIDLAQAESRYVAWDCPDEKLMEMITSGRDVHSYFAANWIFKGKSEELVAKNKKMRDIGKKSGHAANYGVGPRTFAEACLIEAGHYMTEAEAKRIIQAYKHEAFPGVGKRQERIQKEIRHSKTLTTPFGHSRTFYERIGDACFREAYAYAPQATIPFITNQLMMFLFNNFEDLGFLAQIHDSLLLQCDEDRQGEIHEAAKDYKAWHPKITLPGGDLIIPIDMKWGKYWKPMVNA